MELMHKKQFDILDILILGKETRLMSYKMRASYKNVYQNEERNKKKRWSWNQINRVEKMLTL